MSRSQQTKREPINDRNHRLNFGKYRGWAIWEVIREEPSYLEWLCKNTDFELDHKLMEEVEGAYVNAAFEAALEPELRSIKRNVLGGAFD
jgi:hypothetical protein